jgi:hypothetical protein
MYLVENIGAQMWNVSFETWFPGWLHFIVVQYSVFQAIINFIPKVNHMLERRCNVSVALFLCFFILLNIRQTRSWDSAVSIATGYGLDDQEVEVRVPVGSRIFTSPHHPDRLWGSPNLLYNGYQVKWPRREANNSPPTSAEVKKMCICT